MGYSRTSYNNKPKSVVYAYLTAAANTTVATANTFVPIQGTFCNDPFESFHLGTNAIVYDGDTAYYKINWQATFTSEDAGRTIHAGVAINSEVLTTASPSVMGIYAKYAAEALAAGGILVVELSQGDTISLQVTSSTNADVVSFKHFTTMIKRFF